jgi:RNA polymerase sigma-70 factor (ECF subfamily)
LLSAAGPAAISYLTLSQNLRSIQKRHEYPESFLLRTNQMSEKELVRRAQSGDFDAFVELVDSQKGRIYALARKMTGNEQDAEDIVQETLLKAIDNIEQFRGEASFGSWLYAIALNQGRKHLGLEKRTDLRPVEDYLPSTRSGNDHAAIRLFDWRDPHSQLEQEQLAQIIDEAIDELPLKYREAFLLRYYEELSVKEVADIIKQSEAATKSRILRARLALRDKLSSVFEELYGKEMPGIH